MPDSHPPPQHPTLGHSGSSPSCAGTSFTRHLLGVWLLFPGLFILSHGLFTCSGKAGPPAEPGKSTSTSVLVAVVLPTVSRL